MSDQKVSYQVRYRNALSVDIPYRVGWEGKNADEDSLVIIAICGFFKEERCTANATTPLSDILL